MALDKLIIFDTTLRDGEQSPGVCLSTEEKLDIARSLSRLGVDVCEAGFPVASEGDFEAVSRIAKEVGPLMEGRENLKQPMTICALSRAIPKDIDRAFDAVRHAPNHRIHTFLATSDIHLKHKLKITREECVERAVNAVRHAKSLCNDVEFSPEDAGRSDPEFLVHILSCVVEAGATTLNIPDTVGYNTPAEYGELIRFLKQHTDTTSHQVIWSTHCHNDLGLATANTLAGILNGARQVEVTVNGIGERAGNTSLEEIVMIVNTHSSTMPVTTDINTTLLFKLSQLVIQKANKAIVGANAFAHESGIHQDGFLKCQQTYEIMEPSTVGVLKSRLVLGKHSGRNAFRSWLQEVGENEVAENVKRFERIFNSFKSAADAKKNGILTEDDLLVLLDDERGTTTMDSFELRSIQVVSSYAFQPFSNVYSNRPDTEESSSGGAAGGLFATATISILKHSEDTSQENYSDAAIGNGPIQAIFKCINRLVGLHDSAVLVGYEVKSITEGTDALGKVSVRISVPGAGFNDRHVFCDSLDSSEARTTFSGRGAHFDILTASAKAYLSALNRIHAAKPLLFFK